MHTYMELRNYLDATDCPDILNDLKGDLRALYQFALAMSEWVEEGNEAWMAVSEEAYAMHEAVEAVAGLIDRQNGRDAMCCAHNEIT